ncbi:MAG: hypothetical protein FWG91_02110 [Lachnospiraceae bacterium]|nr:hypothetical protein [Lachnospiraceae bacterium]
MDRAFKQFAVFYKVSNTNKSISLMVWVVYVLLASIIALMLLLTSSNDLIFENASINANGGIVSYYLEHNEENGLIMDEHFEKHFDELKLNAKLVERYATVNLSLNGERRPVLLRFQSGIPLNACIMSSTLSESLRAKKDSTLSFDDWDLAFSVNSIENPDFGTLESQYYGYVTINELYIEQILGAIEKANIRLAYDEEADISEALDLYFGDNNIKITRQHYSEIQKNYQLVKEVIKEVIAYLVVLCFIVFTAGFFTFAYLNFSKNIKNFALLRVYGFTRKSAIKISFIDALAFSLSANLIAAPLALLMFKYVTRQAFGASLLVTFWQMVLVFLVVLAISIMINLPLSFLLAKKIFDIDAMNIINGRIHHKADKSLQYPIISIIVFAIIMAAFSNDFSLLLFTLGLMALVAFIYFISKKAINLFRFADKTLTNSLMLSVKLLRGNLRNSAIISTAFVIVAVFIMFIYNLSFGIAKMVENAWIAGVGYNVCVNVMPRDEERFEDLLKEHGLPYFQIYTKIATYHNSERRYFLGILKDENNYSPTLKVLPGTFLADRIVTGAIGLNIGDPYLLEGSDKNLTLADYLTPTPFTPASHTILASHQDMGSAIDETFRNNYLFFLNENEIELLGQILRSWQAEIMTANILTQILTTGMAQYISIIYMASSIIIIALLIFLASLMASTLIKRSPELSLYRALGAKEKKVRRIIYLQYGIIILISSIAAFLLCLAVINLFFLLLMRIAYLPSLLALGITLSVLAAITYLILIAVMKLVDFKALISYKAPM